MRFAKLLLLMSLAACGTDYTPAPPREAHAMAFDAAHDEVVLFGGLEQTGIQDDTWTWDGVGWTARELSVAPSRRTYHAMAYDAQRGRIVLFGGESSDNVALGDTWEWDGDTWLERTPASAPSPRAGAAMAYDEARHRMVLFGGTTGDGFDGLADTWEWDGATWTERTTAGPAGRYFHAMAYDPVRQRIVLVGGTGLGTFDDTWEWDGDAWTRRVGVGPSERRGATLAFDGRELIFFGGLLTADDRISADTWALTDGGWSLLDPATVPAARAFPAMAFDAARGEVVMHGGSPITSPAWDDTQLWNGTDWHVSD